MPHHKTGKIAIQVQFGMEFDCTLVLSVVRPIILIQAEVDRSAVNGMKRIMEFAHKDRSGTAAMPKTSCNNGSRTSFSRTFQNDIGE